LIYEMLAEGEQNARSAKDLAKLLHCDRRAISLMVEAERRQGKPICASCDSKTPGYYIPESKEVMQGYCNRLLHRMGEIAKTRNACLQSMEGLQQ
jgi:biotin operon repressor